MAERERRLQRERGYVDGFWEPRVFDGVRAHAKSLRGHDTFPAVTALDELLFTPLRARGLDLALEVQDKATPRGARSITSLYDVRITDAGKIPTREGSWHDLMNALVFAAFPETKRALHRRHAGELRRHYETLGKLPNARSRLQDVLALFDEGGIVLLGEHDALEEAEAAVARERDAADVLARLCASGDVHALVLGHAILEHHVLGEALPRAMPLFVSTPCRDGGVDRAQLDARLAEIVGALDPDVRRPAVRLDAVFRNDEGDP